MEGQDYVRLVETLDEASGILLRDREATGGSREASLVLTKVQEAQMWAQRIVGVGEQPPSLPIEE